MVWTKYTKPIHVARSLNAAAAEFDKLYPNRSKASDGALGNASHAATVSDHNPCWGCSGSNYGLIRAIDLTTSSWGVAGLKYTAAQRKWHQDLIEDLIETEKNNPVDRLWYIIHYIPGDPYPKIWSRTTGWASKRYTGASPHDHHFHLSIMRTNAAEADTKPWFTKLHNGSGPAPVAWDGKSFPGSDKFVIDSYGSWVTLLGQRLVVHGWTGYLDGPGPSFSETDKKAVAWFQSKHPSITDKPGVVGEITWSLLLSNPQPVVTPPVIEPPVVETPPVVVEPEPETPPVIVTPPVVTPDPKPPVVVPPKPAAGIPEFVGVSFNAAWPGFSSVQAKEAAWSKRLPVLVSKVKAQKPSIVMTQEMGVNEAAAFYKGLGSDWSYQRFGPLNTVGWLNTKFDYAKTLNIDTPDYGQYPGRGYVEAWLKDKKGNRLRIGSGHNPVKTAADGKYQESTIQMIVSGVNNEEDDWPLIWGMDTNNKASKNTGMWVVLKKYGYDWITNKIDAVFTNFGAKASVSKIVDLGIGSDHDMIVFKAKTTKK